MYHFSTFSPQAPTTYVQQEDVGPVTYNARDGWVYIGGTRTHFNGFYNFAVTKDRNGKILSVGVTGVTATMPYNYDAAQTIAYIEWIKARQTAQQPINSIQAVSTFADSEIGGPHSGTMPTDTTPQDISGPNGIHWTFYPGAAEPPNLPPGYSPNDGWVYSGGQRTQFLGFPTYERGFGGHTQQDNGIIGLIITWTPTPAGSSSVPVPPGFSIPRNGPYRPPYGQTPAQHAADIYTWQHPNLAPPITHVDYGNSSGVPANMVPVTRLIASVKSYPLSVCPTKFNCFGLFAAITPQDQPALGGGLGGISLNESNRESAEQSAIINGGNRNALVNKLVYGSPLASNQARVILTSTDGSDNPVNNATAAALNAQAAATGYQAQTQGQVDTTQAAQTAAQTYQLVQGGGTAATLHDALPYLIGGGVALFLIGWILHSHNRQPVTTKRK